MKLPADSKEFIALLNAHGARYVVVGGYAVAYHGYPRFTGDMDVFIEPSEENSRRMEKAIRAFGFDASGLSAADFAKPDMIVQLGVPPNRIDIITGIEAVDFSEAWSSRVEVDLDGVTMSVIGLELLLKNKTATGRPQDRADVERLTENLP